MRKRIISLLLAVSALVLLTACGQEDEITTEETTATAVEITKVTRGSISAQSTVSGQVASGDEQSVSVALSTRCTDVYVRGRRYRIRRSGALHLRCDRHNGQLQNSISKLFQRQKKL